MCTCCVVQSDEGAAVSCKVSVVELCQVRSEAMRVKAYNTKRSMHAVDVSLLIHIHIHIHIRIHIHIPKAKPAVVLLYPLTQSN